MIVTLKYLRGLGVSPPDAKPVLVPVKFFLSKTNLSLSIVLNK
ncbi:hypothetical protein Solca_0153 [Solitalea canadensis DSM 3403]|uniref:Uncharacterized protein n=1 Tax=Solitalea canadensis (strain ATCC 29591 / DSM 3403 / JCM 21819 / LMG 8368 / NBRC 15130 / NCIMB 12057 / USAM 9D) TaxID=929556 RepID=H8KXL0_SOLCM|nr:hypothetical protein Solca_0153 [Solitalea canadensis DSM 3403]